MIIFINRKPQKISKKYLNPPYSCFLFFFSHDMIAYVTLFGICVSVEQLSFTDITMKGRDFMKKTQLKNSLLLLLTATIWGVAFVAQSVGMDHVGPFTFNAIRSIIGGIVLIPCIFFLDHRKSAQKEELPSPQQQVEQTGTLILGGVLLRYSSGTCQQFSADGHPVYNGRTCRIYHCLLYCYRSDSWPFLSE